MIIFCFKQKTAYEMRISDWSSDVWSSDLVEDDHDVRGDRIKERGELVVRHDRSGGVVGAVHEDDPRAVGDGGGHGGEVVAGVVGEGDLDRRGTGDVDEGRVRLEGPPRIDDLAPGPCGGPDQIGRAHV